MKTFRALLLLLLIPVEALAQSVAGGPSPALYQIAQAGGSAPGSAAVGATIPAANTGGGSATVAVIGLGVAGFAAAAAGYSSTAANH